MKKRTLALLMGSLMVASLAFAGCGKTETATTEEETQEDVEAVETVEEDATDDGELDSNDAVETDEQGYATFDNGKYSFKYQPEYITVTEYEDFACIASFYNEDVQTAGSNTVEIYVAYNTPAEEALDSKMSNMGVTDYEVQETYFVTEDNPALCVVYAPEASEGSGLQTSDTIYAVQDGDDTIIVDIFTTVDTDEITNIKKSDAISAVLDSFQIGDAE